ncbi:NAD-dependent epimerase/dehydratase family protein [Vampirovibrio chlorellavorus]|uniref:NAD-dependent epimerase/dehydratase family protein n=1 Tax=Vampirovibrio chlorellavorus TaxID=758823 RepID=UPI0026F26AF1|nr:NAD(P)-dependent oxidoreductase [Vampirovibrio chlorellavorus]
MAQRILVTGSNGYIGGHLARHLFTLEDTEVFGLNQTDDSKLAPHHSLAGNVLEADLLGWLRQVRPHVIYHCIGASPNAPFEHQLRVNAEGTRCLLQALVDANLRPGVVVVGSAAEYGLRDEPVDENTPCQPEGEYGIAKLAQTQIAQSYARRYHLPVIIGRVFNAYGHTARHLAIAALAAQIAQAEAIAPSPAELHVFNLKGHRDFIHIDDVVSALTTLGGRLTRNDLTGKIYNIASGQSTALSTILDLLLAHSTLPADQRQQLNVILNGAQQEDKSWADISKIQEQTGWRPQVDLNTGLWQELEYWRNNIAEDAPPVNVRLS